MKCEHCGQPIPTQIGKTINIDGVEYETETHNFNKKLSDIKIPKGWRLWTIEECIKLYNSKYKKELGLEDCWFFIKQPFELNRKKGYVAWFFAGSDWADLNCDWVPVSHNESLGVRFCRKVKK